MFCIRFYMHGVYNSCAGTFNLIFATTYHEPEKLFCFPVIPANSRLYNKQASTADILGSFRERAKEFSSRHLRK